MTYAVKEIFYTLQGEGANSGRPAVFVRFSGCNLWTGLERDRSKGPGGCSRWCDTNFVGTDGPGGGKFGSPQELVEAVTSHWPRGNGVKPFVVCTGGEPLLQYPFLTKLFPAVHERGIHTTLETNGFLGSRLTDDDLASIDLVMLGLKAIEPDLHRRLTGMDNQPVHEFARRLAARKHPVWIRFVIVPGWTDNMEEVDRMAEFAASLGNVERVDHVVPRRKACESHRLL